MSTPDSGQLLNGLSILVVEDETMLFFLAEDMLIELGCAKVWHAGRLRDALAFLAENRPDAAMLDVNLAGEPVYPVAAILVDRRIPFVFMTGYGPEGIPKEWASRPVVPKPFTSSMVAEAFAKALAR